MIREATIDDILEINKMAPDFWEDALKPLGLGYNPADFVRYLVFLIENPITIILVSEEDGVVTGTAAGILSPWFMDNSQLILTEQWVWVDPESRGKGLFDKLIGGLVDWGKGRGASLLSMIAIGSSTEKQVRDFYEARGFKFAEAHFIREI